MGPLRIFKYHLAWQLFAVIALGAGISLMGKESYFVFSHIIQNDFCANIKGRAVSPALLSLLFCAKRLSISSHLLAQRPERGLEGRPECRQQDQAAAQGEQSGQIPAADGP
jgi:hypothetical protein